MDPAPHLNVQLPTGRRLVATTVETVRFSSPERVDFRLVRGPAPHVVEEFVLTEDEVGMTLHHHGELGTDLGARRPVGNVGAHFWSGRLRPLEMVKTEGNGSMRRRLLMTDDEAWWQVFVAFSAGREIRGIV